jgi:transposase InsO family protein
MGLHQEIVTDNGGPYRSAVGWLEQKYGIKGIKISSYNSKANGKIERPHWDVRQMLYKATGGNPSKWFWFFHHVMWADRVSIRKVDLGAHHSLWLQALILFFLWIFRKLHG